MHREGSVQVVRSLETTRGAAHSWQTPKVENRVPLHASHPVRSLFGPVPGAHVVHRVRPATKLQSPPSFAHPLPSAFRAHAPPWPSSSPVHAGRLTTEGDGQSRHSIPKPDVVVPTHSSHAERSLDGIVPGWQGSHVDWAALATLPGSSHIVQLEPSELTNPMVQSEQSLCDTQRS